MTRTPAYGFSPIDLTPLISLIDAATGGTGKPRPVADPRHLLAQLPPDPNGSQHWAELKAATTKPAAAVCRVPRCTRPADDGAWCERHFPDEVAIDRAVRGESVTLMPHERAEVRARLAARGLTSTQTRRHIEKVTS